LEYSRNIFPLTYGKEETIPSTANHLDKNLVNPNICIRPMLNVLLGKLQAIKLGKSMLKISSSKGLRVLEAITITLAFHTSHLHVGR